MPDSDEVRKEVVETRNQVIKTTHLLGTVAAELKDLRRMAEAHERRLSLNSAVAYVLFAVLLGAGALVAHRATVERLGAERDSIEQDRESLARDLARGKEADDARAQAQERALEIHELLRSGRRKDALDKYPEVAKLPLSKLEAEVLREGIERARGEIGYGAFSSGLDAYESAQWKKAAGELRRAFASSADAPWIPALHYYLGMSLHHLGEYKDAATQLEEAVRIGGEEVGSDAGFYLATAYDELRQRAQAMSQYRRFAAKFPEHRLAASARRRATELAAK